MGGHDQRAPRPAASRSYAPAFGERQQAYSKSRRRPRVGTAGTRYPAASRGSKPRHRRSSANPELESQLRVPSTSLNPSTPGTTGFEWHARDASVQSVANSTHRSGYLTGPDEPFENVRLLDGGDADDVPFTERYPVQRRPAPLPVRGSRRAGATNFPNGFNWFFDDMIGGGTATTASRLGLHERDASTAVGWKPHRFRRRAIHCRRCAGAITNGQRPSTRP